MSKILISSDDPRHNSGVANQCRHIVKQAVNKGHEVICLGTMTSKNLPPPTLHTFDTGEQVKIMNTNAFDDMTAIMGMVEKEKPDCLVLFTDPHQFHNIWLNASFIREKMPIYFVHVWDTYMTGADSGKYHYNLPIYENCDGIGCISKQTEWFVNKVFQKQVYGSKPYIHYVGHGSNPDIYKPLPKEDPELLKVKERLFNGKEFDFVVTMLNRNQGRKKFPDLIEAWRIFFESLPVEQSKKCALVLHTEAVSPIGFNIFEITGALAPQHNIHLSLGKEAEETINCLFNLSDIVCNISNAEGFGLSTNEAMLAGKCILANATGGLVDQIGFFSEGLPIPWTLANKQALPTLQHGNWAYPVFGQRTIIGNPGNQFKPGTHFLYDENCSIDDVVKGLQYWHHIDKAERDARGLQGRNWCLERGLNNKDFSRAVVAGIEKTISSFQPKPLFQLYNT